MLAFWLALFGFDVTACVFDLILPSKPLGWILAGWMLLLAGWAAFNAVKLIRRRLLSPKNDPDFRTRRD